MPRYGPRSALGNHQSLIRDKASRSNSGSWCGGSLVVLAGKCFLQKDVLSNLVGGGAQGKDLFLLFFSVLFECFIVHLSHIISINRAH